MSNIVELTPCLKYDLIKVEQLLKDQMIHSGVLEKIHEGMTIALKLNLVAAMKPETAVFPPPMTNTSRFL